MLCICCCSALRKRISGTRGGTRGRVRKTKHIAATDWSNRQLIPRPPHETNQMARSKPTQVSYLYCALSPSIPPRHRRTYSRRHTHIHGAQHKNNSARGFAFNSRVRRTTRGGGGVESRRNVLGTEITQTTTTGRPASDTGNPWVLRKPARPSTRELPQNLRILRPDHFLRTH